MIDEVHDLTGDQIKAIRGSRGETQAQFAAHFGVDQPTVHRWETKGVTKRGLTANAVERILSELLDPAETEKAS